MNRSNGNPANNMPNRKDRSKAFAMLFFHPDYTVGFGISPNPALSRLRTLPPIGNFTLP